MAGCWRCWVAEIDVNHHPLLPGPDHAYLYRDLTCGICLPCHQGAHGLLKAANLEVVEDITAAVIDGRIANWLAWLDWDWLGCPGTVRLPRGHLGALAGVLVDNARGRWGPR